MSITKAGVEEPKASYSNNCIVYKLSIRLKIDNRGKKRHNNTEFKEVDESGTLK
jgi:hypothetical protein